MSPSFSLCAGPGTDIWKKPPTTDVFNGGAPPPQLVQLIVSENLPLTQTRTHLAAPFQTHSSGTVGSFRAASLTFTAVYTKRYDQAGLLLRLTHPSHPRKWVKTGIELYEGLPRLSTVSCDGWADWSVGPAPCAEDVATGDRSVTVQVRSEGDENGRSWWVYHVDGEVSTPLREICWIADGQYADWTLDVAALVARPAKDGEDDLEARFEDFTVEWA